MHREVIAELKAAGASWIQFDEPTLVMDLDSHQLQAFTEAYSELESSFSGLNVLIETYFADVPAEAYKLVGSLVYFLSPDIFLLTNHFFFLLLQDNHCLEGHLWFWF